MTTTCHLDFQKFPFDSHTCIMLLRNWIGSSYRIRLNSPQIYTYENGKQIGGKVFKMTESTLNYNFEFESLESTTIAEKGSEYSIAQVKINTSRNRNGRNKVFSGYHIPTAIFTILSLASYFIEIEQVPGRMGLLITLYVLNSDQYI